MANLIDISLFHVPWHWAFSGFMIALVMFLLLFAGRSFGVSSSFDALCTLAGAGKKVKYFEGDWRQRSWMLVFLLGTVGGAAIATRWMQSPEPVNISQATRDDLSALGIHAPATLSDGSGYVPEEIFNFRSLLTWRGFILLIVGGFLIGFGTRWAGGCTSGHAISGLSNLQLPSLIAVIGFFIGGLIMTHLLLPIILKL
ncbi:MAG TPA: YeeE/YedE thiosulfate transporter family protein [Saprospiraceae bacterium]|nr:YeeE/YedE thiosulfate transporter family protein [Saprospiraceae bacterium]